MKTYHHLHPLTRCREKIPEMASREWRCINCDEDLLIFIKGTIRCPYVEYWSCAYTPLSKCDIKMCENCILVHDSRLHSHPLEHVASKLKALRKPRKGCIACDNSDGAPFWSICTQCDFYLCSGCEVGAKCT